MKENLNYPYLYLLMICIGAGSQAEGNEMKTRCKQMLWSVRTPVAFLFHIGHRGLPVAPADTITALNVCCDG